MERKRNFRILKNEFNSVFLDKTLYKNLPHGAFDTYLILIHLFLKNGEKIFINTDDILSFRGIKKIAQKGFNPSGYKKNVREKIVEYVEFLENLNLILIENKQNYDFKIKMNTNYLQNGKITLPLKLLHYNPHKNSWHKDIGYFLSIYKQKKSKTAILQIQKILKEIKNNYSFLAPNEIRNRFENTMDDLAQANIIQNWYYKNIDEEFLNCKNWLWWWEKLSVKVDFDILVKPPCFLNF